MKELSTILGLSKKEMEVFLKLLTLGAQPISVIAKQMNLPRSSVYTVIERLKKEDIVETFQRSGILYTKAIPAKNLPQIIQMKLENLEKGLNIIKAKLPELQSIENKFGITPTIIFYEGKKAITKMYQKIMNGKEFCALFNPKLVKLLMPEYLSRVGEAIHKQKWQVRELLVDCEEARDYKKQFQTKFHKIKLLKKGAYFASDTIIYDDRIFMISYGEKDLTGTEIVNLSFAHTHQTLFDLIWKG